MGGGVMRTTAKAAMLAGRRSSYTSSSATSSAVASVGVAAGEPDPSAVSAAGTGTSASAVVQRQIVVPWEINDWPDWELLPTPRLVFGPPPTIEEAREATADLKEALETAYVTTDVADESHCRTSVPHCEAKGCATNFGQAVIPAMPSFVKHAFALFQGSTEAQEVVASLAADENVWDAVMKNKKVAQFCMNYQPTLSPNERVTDYEENTPMHMNENGEASSEDTDAVSMKNSETSVNMLSEYMTKIKTKLSEMVSNLSEFFQEMGTLLESSSSPRTKTTTAENENAVFGSFFIALAIAAIIVVVLKRE